MKKGEGRTQQSQPRKKSRDNRQVDEAKINVGLFEQVDNARNVIWGTMIPVNGQKATLEKFEDMLVILNVKNTLHVV